MLVLQSLLVYIFMTWIMTIYGIKAYKYQYPQGIDGYDRLYQKKNGPIQILLRPYYYIPIFVYCLFSAIRYKVGVDCETYKEIYYQYVSGFDRYFLSEKGEWGFKFVVEFTSAIFNSHYLYMGILVFLQIFPLYYAFKNQRYFLPFLGIALMFSEVYLSLMNGMRQNIAACMFVMIVPFIVEKKWFKVLFIVVIAMSIHKTALILIPLGVGAYFLQKGIIIVFATSYYSIFCA